MIRTFIIICQEPSEWVPVTEPLPEAKPVVEYGARWFQIDETKGENAYYTNGKAPRLVRLMHQRLRKSFPDLDRSTVTYVCYEVGADKRGWLKYCWETPYSLARHNIS
jgi:hypothetical protein